MIEGVRIKRLITHCDDRGYFREVLRDSDELLPHVAQTSVTLTYPGVIKAFHWHEHQDDVWYVAQGMVRVGLYDLRPESPTHRQKDELFLGEQNPCALLVPRRVAHGYQVLGTTPALVFYLTSSAYNPDNPDEQRIPFDDPEIGFDWSIRNR